MATPVIMPQPGITVETCIMTKWHKNKGDSVKKGEILFSYETDKAAFDEECPEDGTLLDIFYDENDEVPCRDNVCVIGNAGEDTSAFAPNGAAAPEQAPAEEKKEEPAKVEVETKVEVQAVAVDTTGKIKISPRAKALADKMKADLRQAKASGPDGRIIERDVIALIDEGKLITGGAMTVGVGDTMTGTGIGGRISTADLGGVQAPAAAAANVPEAEYVDVKMSNVRKVIAKSMVNSLSTMAQLTHTIAFDATNIQNFRKTLKANGETLGLPNITINDIIIFAVSRVLKNHKDLNAHLINGDTIRQFTGVNMGIAVDTERGLLVPTLFGADKMTLAEISTNAKSLAKAAQSGTIAPELLQGASFTISNLGIFGIESFTPVINPPQTGILGVNALQTRVREVNGELKAYEAMTLSLTYDHRALDGVPASKFLKDLKIALENFSVFLAK